MKRGGGLLLFLNYNIGAEAPRPNFFGGRDFCFLCHSWPKIFAVCLHFPAPTATPPTPPSNPQYGGNPLNSPQSAKDRSPKQPKDHPNPNPNPFLLPRPLDYLPHPPQPPCPICPLPRGRKGLTWPRGLLSRSSVLGGPGATGFWGSLGPVGTPYFSPQP